MERIPLIAGNWKMNLNLSQARQLAQDVSLAAAQAKDREVMIAPTFTSLALVSETLNNTSVHLAGQNCCWAKNGAFTGEISPAMLKELGCTMVILGHSERRHVFGESDAIINKRLLGAHDQDLNPILCIGETLEQRETDQTMPVLESQIRLGLKDLVLRDPSRLVLAYEPVWAIGTGKTASKEQAQETHKFIRSILGDIYQKSIASQIRILYGGSVNPENIDSLMAQDDVDGALVGGAALKAKMFNRIICFKE